MTNFADVGLMQVLACPRDHTRFHAESGSICCEAGHLFRLEQGIPILTEHPRREAVPQNMAACRREDEQSAIDPFVDDWLVNTNGNLYWHARGRLRRYPIPQWPTKAGNGRTLVDIGCGWGRWTMAAAQAGFKPFGVDVHLDALFAAARVSRQIDAPSSYVCSDADTLPFLAGSVDVVYSYSVLQHLEKTRVFETFREISRILRPGGFCLMQIPNSIGAFNLLRQARRGFRPAKADSFEMRYWSRAEVQRAIREAGLVDLTFRPDGFFSQNPQWSDLDLLSPAGKLVVLTSHAGCQAARALPFLSHLADSWFVEAHRPE